MGTTVKEISVWKALNDKKLLRKRIESASHNGTYVCSATAAEDTIGGVPREDYVKKMKASFESIVALHKNLAAYDAAIAQFNASHTIVIGEKEYVVAAAIARHQRLPEEKAFLNAVRNQLVKVVSKLVSENERIMDDERVTNGISKLVSDRKLNTTEMKNVLDQLREDYIKNNKLILLDPCDLYNKLDGMIEEITTFENEYNEAFNRLNVSNMITIELEDVVL